MRPPATDDVEHENELEDAIRTAARSRVFAPDENGTLQFHALGSLSNGQVADLMQAVRIRVLRFLARRGVIDDGAGTRDIFTFAPPGFPRMKTSHWLQ